MLKKMAYAVSVALGLGLAASAGAAGTNVVINPDGAGVDAATSVGSLDWATSSGLAVGASGGSPAGTLSTFYAHAFLQGFQDGNGLAIGGLGLNTAYEWTYVTGFQERIVSNSAGNIRFASTGTGTNFFQIYLDTSRDANPLTGTGFNNGVLVLSGHVLAATDPVLGNSNFSITGGTGPVGSPTGPVVLDQFGGNNYPGQLTVTGTGGGQIAVQVDSFDSGIFTGISLGQVFQLAFDTQQNLPFRQTQPSGCFWNGAALIPGAGAAACPGGSSLGVNGLTGPNTEIQTDSSTSFLVPEPGSLLLLGIGLMGLGTVLRRKQAA